ncbi:Polyketide synthase dehydratase [Actinopolyspora alba]|uniref:Polyketide synthase dehydratase n=1 Tax=Actinopolyspora alba TaxID=673379 RepID=A0A1I1X0I7_9ACTN|nr:SDR family oxidoreductase [Actinopolyspora alba]SFD99203.1 Polyketide synthase dehydratase [Actinopolyspora alba]
MITDFTGKVVLVTGGAKGVGGAITTAFAHSGAHVIVNYFHSADEARELVSTITQDTPGSAEMLRASVARRTEVAEMFTEVHRRHGGLDVLVNNAARGAMDPIGRTEDSEWKRVLDVDLHGTRWCIEYAVPLLELGDGGVVVNISAIAAQYAFGNFAPGGAAKAAMESLSRHLAAELAPAGIRLNVVSSGLLDNDTLPLFPDSDRMAATITAGTPLGRLSTEDDLTGATLFLASPLAAGITGQTLVVDGGLTLFNASLSPPRSDPPTWTTTFPAQQRGLLPAAQQTPTTRVGTESTAEPTTVTEPPRNHSPQRDRTAEDRLIAVVGTGLVAPGANDPEEFWRLLGQSEDAFGEPPRFNVDHIHSAAPEAEDKGYSRVFGFIRDFQPHPTLAAELAEGHWSRQDLAPLFLRHALLQAREGITIGQDTRCGLYAGAWTGSSQSLEDSLLVHAGTRGAAARLSGNGHEERLREVLRRHFQHAGTRPRYCLPDMVLRTAMSGLLPESSDTLAVDTACSSSLYAVDIGVKNLLSGRCDLAMCGGTGTVDRRVMVLFSKLRGLSRTGEVRAFDADATGVLFSECAGIVALKRLSDARDNGDEILGVLTGFGGASDGSGQAIAAPSETGQGLAIDRARTVNGTTSEDVGWVVGHGTGTVAGDTVELRTLAHRARIGGLPVTSNKSLVGHGGWTAGLLSLIHALLGLRHKRIPAQQHFATLPPDVPPDTITVPTTDLTWNDNRDHPSVVGVSGFGFGGTNAHQLVSEPELSTTEPLPTSGPPQSEDQMVLIAWSAHLPGHPDHDAVRQWLIGQGKAPPRSFGEDYPLPPIPVRRLPDTTARGIDRCQLMALEVAHQFTSEHGELWADHRDTTGVIAAHMGPPRAMADYTLRVGTDELLAAVRWESDSPNEDEQAMRDFLHAHRQTVPASNEESMPGVMTNIVASRIPNRFDLHGPSMTVDSGHASTTAALDVAGQYLRTGELDLALVLGANGNTTPEMAEIVELPQHQLAEGAFLFALTREGLAHQQGWPILARIHSALQHAEPNGTPPALEWGTDDEPSYLAADAAPALIRAVESGTPETEIDTRDRGPRITVTTTTDAAGTPPSPRPATSPATSDISPGGTAIPIERYTPVTRRVELVPAGPELPSIPPRGIALVGSAELAKQLSERIYHTGAILLSTDPDTPSDVATVVDPSASELGTALDVIEQASPHVRIIASSRETTQPWPTPPPQPLLRLPELAVLVCQRLGTRLRDGSVAALLLDTLRTENPHPHLTLISGFLRSLRRELNTPVWAVATNAELSDALDELQRESAADDEHTLVLYRNGARYLERLRPLPAAATRELIVDSSSVVVATGGARGITAVALTALARQARPKLWLLGSTPPDQAIPPEISDATEEELPKLRARYLNEARRAEPDRTIPELNARFDQLLRAREVTATLDNLRELLGNQRVRYLRCDVTDPDEVRHAATAIHAEDGHVDLLVHAAGRNRSAALESKTLSDYRAVRDPKVTGYHNLKAAFRDPEPGYWCNFGSALGTVGLDGETDYVPANEYLANAARHTDRRGSGTEFTIGWSLWGEAGMRANTPESATKHLPEPISNAKGATDFLTELSTARAPESYALHLPDNTGRTHTALLTGHLETSESTDRVGQGVLAEPEHHDDGQATWSWRADLKRDGFPLEHVIAGKPVLPGQFMVALAGEAAMATVPGTVVRGWREVRFDHFAFALSRGEPVPYGIRAELLAHDTPTHRVLVTVLSDVVAPDGRILQHDREHCRAEVLLGSPRTPPTWQPPPVPADAVRTVDPFTRPESEINLSGIFRTTTAVTVDPHGGRGRWLPGIDSTDGLSALRLPALLLDSLIRSRSFVTTEQDTIATSVPLRLGHIDLYTTDNDARLARRHPSGIELHHDAEASVCTASTVDGHMLVQISDIDTKLASTMPLDEP